MVTASILLDRLPTARSGTSLRSLCKKGPRTHFLISTLLPNPIIVLQARLALMPGPLMHNTMLFTTGRTHENGVIRFMDLAGLARVIQAPAEIRDCADGGTC
jgi:hypothetical protein